MAGIDREWGFGLKGLPTATLEHWSAEAPASYRPTGQICPITYRYLDDPEIDTVLALQDRVLAGLPNPDVLRAVPADRHARILRTQGRTAGAFDGRRLIGYAAAQYPITLTEHQGRTINLSQAALDRSAQMEGLVVDPDYRGGRIGRRLNELRLVYALARGFRHAVATISPRNRYSLQAFVPTGLIVRGLSRGHGKALRYTLHDDLGSEVSFDAETTVEVPTADLDAQDALLAEGYSGIGPTLVSGALCMRYARVTWKSADRKPQ